MGFFATDEEQTLVSRIFALAGDQVLGVITGDATVEVFAETVDLPPAVLGTIWNIADEANNGSLSERGLAIAVRLIGWAQSGEDVTSALVNIRAFLCACLLFSILKSFPAGPVPKIKGISDELTSSSTPSNSETLPPFTSEDHKRLRNRFVECGPTNGFLDGEIFFCGLYSRSPISYA